MSLVFLFEKNRSATPSHQCLVVLNCCACVRGSGARVTVCYLVILSRNWKYNETAIICFHVGPASRLLILTGFVPGFVDPPIQL